MKFTVLGGGGFIGAHLVKHLISLGHQCFAPKRGDDVPMTNLGHVIYCIGLTADFRDRPIETVDAHVCALLPLLSASGFDSLLYLSSTRVYAGSGVGREDQPLVVKSEDPDHLYNISKLMGEASCLGSGNASVRVARVSNVYGNDFRSDNFLHSVIREAVENGRVLIRNSPESEKDYISIDDVVTLLPKIATLGKHRLYNVASGRNVSNAMLASLLQEHTGCVVSFQSGASKTTFPNMDISRVRQEFNYIPGEIADHIRVLVDAFREKYGKTR
jgi:nucleoside-diphosphate-sugar epimerase